MRGFRASRAAQNLKSSRFGNESKTGQFEVTNRRQNMGQQHQQQAAKLPEWLRMPAEKPVAKVISIKSARVAKSAVKPAAKKARKAA